VSHVLALLIDRILSLCFMFYVSCFMFCIDAMTRNYDNSSNGSNNVTINTKKKTQEKLAGDVE
jgi:hypothetical protein